MTSTRAPDGTTTRSPARSGGTLTTGVGPGGASIVASSAASHASWTASLPITSSWISRPPLTTCRRTVSPGTTSTGSGRKTQSLSTTFSSRGATDVPGSTGGVAGGDPAPHAETRQTVTARMARRTARVYGGPRRAPPAARVRSARRPGLWLDTGGSGTAQCGIACAGARVEHRRARTEGRPGPRPRIRLAVPTPTVVPAPASAASVHGPAVAEAIPAVRLEQLTKEFGNDAAGKRVSATIQAATGTPSLVAVDHIDLDVRDGEFFSMLGPSGSGKTTTLRMIAGFELPTSGKVYLHGVDVSNQPPFQRDVNTVFQDYALFPHMTVADNVAYGLVVRKVAKGERQRRVGEALEMVRLSGYERRKPSQLSGGQRQRVALARALVNRPRVLLLDEPLGALDLKLREEMQIELKGIQQQVGITFIYVTHDQEEALTMSDRLAVFNRGRIEQVGAPAEVYERPATSFVAGFVGTSNLLRGEVARTIVGDAATYTVRPEKIRLGAESEAAGTDETSALGHVRSVVYLGPDTRFVVALDAGADLVVTQQNLVTSSTDALALEGTRVRLIWKRSHNYRVADSAA